MGAVVNRRVWLKRVAVAALLTGGLALSTAASLGNGNLRQLTLSAGEAAALAAGRSPGERGAAWLDKVKRAFARAPLNRVSRRAPNASEKEPLPELQALMEAGPVGAGALPSNPAEALLAESRLDPGAAASAGFPAAGRTSGFLGSTFGFAFPPRPGGGGGGVPPEGIGGTAPMPPGSAAAIPEPSTWALMLLGFGAVGTAIRRRRVPDSPPGHQSRP